LFRCTAAVIHFGNISWKQRPREEQADVESVEECEKIAQLLGLQTQELLKGLMKPKIRVGV
jgi:myosin heavy subunit